jgi:hypothetical protein
MLSLWRARTVALGLPDRFFPAPLSRGPHLLAPFTDRHRFLVPHSRAVSVRRGLCRGARPSAASPARGAAPSVASPSAALLLALACPRPLGANGLVLAGLPLPRLPACSAAIPRDDRDDAGSLRAEAPFARFMPNTPTALATTPLAAVFGSWIGGLCQRAARQSRRGRRGKGQPRMPTVAQPGRINSDEFLPRRTSSANCTPSGLFGRRCTTDGTIAYPGGTGSN